MHTFVFLFSLLLFYLIEVVRIVRACITFPVCFLTAKGTSLSADSFTFRLWIGWLSSTWCRVFLRLLHRTSSIRHTVDLRFLVVVGRDTIWICSRQGFTAKCLLIGQLASFVTQRCVVWVTADEDAEGASSVVFFRQDLGHHLVDKDAIEFDREEFDFLLVTLEAFRAIFIQHGDIGDCLWHVHRILTLWIAWARNEEILIGAS